MSRHRKRHCRLAAEEKAAAEKGKKHEDMFFAALSNPDWERPHWIEDIRRATRDEDQHGTDGWVQLDVGLVPIQIKSSHGGAKEHRAHYPGSNHLVVIVTDACTPQMMRRDFRQQALHRRAAMCAAALKAKESLHTS